MTTADPSDEPNVEAAFALGSPEENRDLYARWAESYDSGFVEEAGYINHRNVAAVHARSWTDETRQGDRHEIGAVLDVGCGTGVVGVELRRLGASIVDGVDISPEMLAKAADKHDERGPVYRHLAEVDLTEDPELPDQNYQGVVSAGAFTHGHLGPETLVHLIELTGAGTRFTIGINEAHFVDHGYEQQLRQLEQAEGIASVEMLRVPIYEVADPDNLNHSSQVVAFTVR